MSGLGYQITQYFRQGDALARLILINIAVYLLYVLIVIFSSLFQSDFHQDFTYWMALPAALPSLAVKPWTLISSMFFHRDFLHILFNMLYLYFSGMLFMQFMNGRRLLSTYLLGGLSGALLYIISYNIFPAFSASITQSHALGASAGVMAVLVSVATYAPNMEVRLFFTLRVKLWIVAVIAVLIDLITFTDGNQGGHIAHLGGAMFGYFSIRMIRNGQDITEPFSRMMDRLVNLFQKKPKVRKVYSRGKKKETGFRQRRSNDQHKMDEILDKISRSGYDSLSKEEKDFLFKIGKD